MQQDGSRIKKTLISWLFNKRASLSLVPVFSLGIFLILPLFGYSKIAQSDQETIYSPTTNLYNSQTLSLLNSKERPSPKGGVGGTDPILTDDGALMADVSPITDVNPDLVFVTSTGPEDISVYTVREGDTLGTIAEMFDISPNTIRWANDIDVKGTIKPGQELVILPISGIKHKVLKGETFASIAKKYKGDAREISLFNGIEEGEALVVGTEIIIPNGESAEVAPVKKPTTGTKGSPSKEVPSGYYGKAVSGIKTQGKHDKWAIDVGAKTGTTVWAMAPGKVIVSRSGGWGGGYGSYVVISHDNGTQTLYAHLSRVDVTQGQTVGRGAVIGAVGSTGRSTGPHLHVEIRPGKTGIDPIAILEKMY